MDNSFDLSINLSQKLLMTPQLKFALEVLKMNTQELYNCIVEQMENNPMLEIAENENVPDMDDSPELIDFEDMEEDYNEKYNDSFQKHSKSNHTDLTGFAIEKGTEMLTLKQHLLFQLHTSNLSSKQIEIGEFLIDNVNENGYLDIKPEDISTHMKVSSDAVDEVKRHIQTFDPPGICAMNLKECLLIQLRQKECADPVIFNLVENFLDDLASNRISAIAKKNNIDIKEVLEKLEYIKSLEPKPGRAFCNNGEVRYIIPDVLVKKAGNKFEVQINEDRIPTLEINDYGKRIFVNGNLTHREYNYYHNEIKNAEWFIKCIEQRKKTLIKVARSIVERQSDFFKTEKNILKPLTLKEIAQELGIHESTVSRAISGKYMQCPGGIFELRYFFPSKINVDKGSGMSSINAKNLIGDIVNSEDKANPVNDSEIAELLHKQGIQISRRTVAKYRSELEIPTVDRRKRY